MITRKERDIIILKKIIIYCEQVDETITRFGNDVEIFKNDHIYINAIGMPIMQIGELANHLSEEFKESNKNMPWHLIRAMRNWFAHSYYEMDVNRIWSTATEDIPLLREFCEGVLNSQ